MEPDLKGKKLSKIQDDVWINGYRGGYFEACPTGKVLRECLFSTRHMKTFERGFAAGTRSWRKHKGEADD